MPPAAASTNPVNRRISFAATPSSSRMPDWNSANNQQGERFSAAVEALFRQEAEYFRNMGLAGQRRLHRLWDRSAANLAAYHRLPQVMLMTTFHPDLPLSRCNLPFSFELDFFLSFQCIWSYDQYKRGEKVDVGIVTG